MNKVYGLDQSPECAICLDTIRQEDKADPKCCKAIIHQRCYLECVNKYNKCPWCQRDVTPLKLFFLGFERYTKTNNNFFNKYVNSSPVWLTYSSILMDMGPWKNFDDFLTVAQRERVYKKQMMASDLVIVKLDYPKLDHAILQQAIDNHKAILVLENVNSVPKKRYNRYYKQAQIHSESLDERVFYTVDQVKDIYNSKKSYIDSLLAREKKSGSFLYRLKNLFIS